MPDPREEPSPLETLIEIMRQLRDPERGCPWDIAQTFRTIAPYTIEEAYEVLDAIERDDREDLRDELGDLLLQVVFHARMAEEEGAFDFDDVARAIVDKMTRRHPHVFGPAHGEVRNAVRDGVRSGPGSKASGRTGIETGDSAERLDAWESEKARERTAKTARLAAASETPSAERAPPSALDGVAASLPALLRADKLQRRAARVRLRLAGRRAVCERSSTRRSSRSTRRSRAAMRTRSGRDRRSAVHGGQPRPSPRHRPEGALRRSNAKFERRFRRVEVLANEASTALDVLDLAALDALWERAKR